MNRLQTLTLVVIAALAGFQAPTTAEGPAPATASSDTDRAVSATRASATIDGQHYPDPEPARLRSFIELARRDVQLQKASIVADNIPFTEAEAAEFWPIHREYEAALLKLNDRRIDLVRRFLPTATAMSDEDARALAKEAFEIDEARTALKREYFEKFQVVIPPAKAVRFFQIENQLNMVLDLRVAAALPLIK